ncbi:RNA polymerase II transcription factor B subunit 4 [Saitozyma podzolica]|uniref:General transcription and DNA repair factor IIH subunit TFB4 n=1 Tax=Saitozyma podzolica TaxID=1890683 RepID=A0A427Y7R1_9TREE|nr:RNA polymerase II transcription factor B subunit 4 [Saitozyma podzolica]
MLPPDPSAYPSVTPPSLLLIILDLHPLSWSLLATPPAEPPGVPEITPSGQARLIGRALPTALAASEFITMLLVFLNAHLASRWGNRVVVYGATGGRSTGWSVRRMTHRRRRKLLYPPPANEAGPSKPRPNTYLPFQLLDSRLEHSLRQMAAEEEERARETDGNGLNGGLWVGFTHHSLINLRMTAQHGDDRVVDALLISALAKALCYINRQHPESTATHALSSSDAKTSGTGPEQLETRILVINATPGSGASQEAGTGGENGAGAVGAENSDKGADDRTDTGKGKGKGDAGMRGGYVGLMNCVFAAQKAKLPIDVLTLPPPGGGTAPPIFLQQAAHLTEGIYWRWNGRGGLLQYLHAIYLPPPSLRKTPFAVPPQDAVDFRARVSEHLLQASTILLDVQNEIPNQVPTHAQSPRGEHRADSCAEYDPAAAGTAW